MEMKGLMKHRWLSLMVVVLFFTVFVAGCGGQSSNGQSSPDNSTSNGGTDKSEVEKNVPKTVAEIALYEGDDREQLLIDAAKKEGELNLYSSMSAKDAQAIAGKFEEKYGIKVNLWRASSSKVLQRALTEAQGGKFVVDAVETNGPELEAMYREKLLQEVKSPYQKDLIEQALPEHKSWIADRLNIFVQAYNTDKVKKEDLPKTWEDLKDPQWKGKIGIEAGDYDWYAGLSKEFGDKEMANIFKDIKKTNGLSVRKGHTLLTQLVASGEVPLALDVYNYKPEQLKNDGAPVDWFAIEPAIARPNGVAVMKKAQHPYAAVLFYDYLISEGQQALVDKNIVPTSTKVDTNLNKMKMRFIDPAVILDEQQKWQQAYEDNIIN